MSERGFTLVEILTVIVVLAILAGVSIVGYGAWRENTARTELKNDLQAAASAMDSFKTFQNGYSLSVPNDYQKSENVTTIVKYVESEGFCLEATTRTAAGLVWNFKKSNGEPREGACDNLGSSLYVDGVQTKCREILTQTGLPKICAPDV